MAEIVVKVENLWKQYQLGVTGASSLRDDFSRLLAKISGKEDPTLKIGEQNQLNADKSAYVWALENISFEVQKGEVLGIIGKNGAGKSTLLKILSKITAPTQGKIQLKGRVASLLEVGTGFHPELTGRENIFLNGAILGMTKTEIRNKLEEIIEFAGVAKYVDTPVKRYSSGMYVRLAFAVAAHLEPEILIIDEVLAVGDAEFQKKALGKMKDISQGEGRTVLFVSHNMAAVRSLCSRGVFLEYGKVTLIADIHEIVEKYLAQETQSAQKNTICFSFSHLKDFQLLEATIQTQAGETREIFDCEEDIVLFLKCYSQKSIPEMYAYLAIFKNDGTLVLESDSYDNPPNLFENLPQGEHHFSITIPKRTLGIGNYTVYMNFASHKHANFDVDSPQYILKFQLIDTTSKRGSRRAGFFSTLLAWNKILEA